MIISSKIEEIIFLAQYLYKRIRLCTNTPYYIYYYGWAD